MVVPRVPERTDGYVLSRAAVDELASAGATVLIAVDCGITAVDEIGYANSLGMTSIVVDHHRPRNDGLLPEALIVHPNLLDPDAVPMCAAAVAGILIEELGGALGLSVEGVGIHELQALATITDLMPLEGINRSIVIRGLKSMQSTGNIGLSALIDAVGLDRTRINSRTLGFTLGPRINAAGRVRAAGAALELLLTEDRARADALAVELETANIERRRLQQETTYAAERLANDLSGRAGWVLASPDWHKGVVGIVAGNLAGRFHRPTIVLAVEGEFATGSARSVPGFNVAAAIEECSELLERHGGHAAAAGVTIRSERIEEFSERFAEIVERALPIELRTPSVVADAVVAPSEMNLQFAEELELLEPVGEGNRAPLVSMPQVRCTQLRRMGEGKHGRFRIENSTGSCSAVAFNLADRVEVEWGSQCNVVGRLEVNRYNGAEEPRVVAERVVPTKTSVSAPSDGLPWLDELQLHFGDLSSGAREPVEVSHARLEILHASLGPAVDDDLAAVLQSFQTEGAVAVLAADADRRRGAIDAMARGITLLSWKTLEVAPSLLQGIGRVVMYDPPASLRQLETAVSAVDGRVHRVWQSAQVRFAVRALEHEFEIEARIRPFYSGIRSAIGGSTESMLKALQGPGEFPNPPRQSARMLCVLSEIGALKVDIDPLSITLDEPTMRLEDSNLLAAFGRELGAGLAFLESMNGLSRDPR